MHYTHRKKVIEGGLDIYASRYRSPRCCNCVPLEMQSPVISQRSRLPVLGTCLWGYIGGPELLTCPQTWYISGNFSLPATRGNFEKCGPWPRVVYPGCVSDWPWLCHTPMHPIVSEAREPLRCWYIREYSREYRGSGENISKRII